MKEKNSFIVYYEWEEMFGYMSDKQTADMLRAMFGYAKRGDLPEFSNPLLNSNFCVMKYAIDRNNEKYKSKCDKNKENAKLRWEKEKCNGIKNMRTHKIYADNDNVNDNENDNVNENENDNVNENENDNVNENEKYNISISSSPAVTDSKPSSTYSEDFLEFWSAYPKKVGKGAAYKIFNKLKLTKKEKSAILTALDWQKKSDQWVRDNGQFIPYPSTYLNQRRWEDEPQSLFCGDITDPDRYKEDEEDYFDFGGAYGE
ncbi:MAG: hypothetical protein IJN94_04350 [Clostridia bacterium]|nr:hypothetical protein [Clostridia bacterium]